MTDSMRRLLSGVAFSVFALSAATTAYAEEAPADAALDGEEIVVTGQGQTRQIQVISSADIALQTPGISPLKAINKLPGVNFQSADAFGNYEWSARISIRGFNQNQLGFTLDGVPLGDMSYGNHNGLHISRALISENTGRIEVAQGAGALSAASSSNLGGTIEFFTRGPKDEFGVEANGTYGSEDTIRGFARVDTGTLGDNGPKASLSYAYHTSDKWKGDGKQKQHQVNARIEQPLADGKIYAFVNWSDRRENDYQDLSLNMIDRLGYNWDNFANDWELAELVAHIGNNRGDTGAPVSDASAGTVYPGKVATVDDAYYDAAGLRKDWLASLGYDTKVGENITLKGNGYYHRNRGRGMWYTPYVPTPGGSPISIRTTEYEVDRWGVTGSVAYESGPNTIEVGGWFEDNDFNQARRFYGLEGGRDRPSQSPLKFPKDPFATQWEFDFKTKTYQYFVQDTLDLGQFVVNAGWKGLKVDNEGQQVVVSTLAEGTIQAKDWFLPQVGALYRITDNEEVFANFTQNMRAYASSATEGPFATTQAGFDALDLKPEKSTTYELGFRTKSSRFQGVIAGYYVDFKNRLISGGSGIVGRPVSLRNAGDVRSIGIEAAGTYTVVPGLTLFGSYSYNESEYKDNVLNADGSVQVAIKDKTVVNSPKHLARGEVTWDRDGFLARFSGNYTSRRYFTYTNDQSVKGFVIFDATIGYTFDTGMMQGITIEGNATNLFDKKYVSTIGSNGFGNSGDNQTLLAGAPQQFFVTVKTKF